MKHVLVVEGLSDQAFFKRLLHAHNLAGVVRVVVAHGKNAARPITAKLLRSGDTRVAMVYDADTVDVDAAEDERKGIEWYLSRWSERSCFELVAMVPELEVIFFEQPTMLTELLGYEPSDMFLRAGQRAPYQLLADLMKGETSWWKRLNLITDEQFIRLEEHPKMKQLLTFLRTESPREVSKALQA